MTTFRLARFRQPRLLSWFLLLLLVALAGTSLAVPLSRGMIDNLEVTVAGRKYLCALFPSQDDPARWYAVLKTPFLVERQIDGVTEPELQVFRFQRADPKNPNQLLEQGVLQCAFAVAPPEEVMGKLKTLVPPPPGGRPVHLEPMPLPGVSLDIFSMLGKKIAAIASPTRGIGGADQMRTAAFTVSIPTLDSGFLKVLMEDPTGVKFELRYNAAFFDLPPAGGRGSIDAERGMRSPTGGSQAPTGTGQSGALLPTRTTGTSQTTGSSRTTGTSTGSGLLPGGGRSAGSQQDLGRTGGRTGTGTGTGSSAGATDLQVFQRAKAARQGWSFAAHGFLGLGRYAKAVRDRHLVSESNLDGWHQAFLILPRIPEIPGAPLQSASLDVSLLLGTQEYGTWPLTWTSAKGWRDSDAKPVQILAVPLKNVLAASGDPLKSAVFRVRRRLVLSSTDLLEGEERFPVVMGETPLSSPSDLAEILSLDFSLIDWTAPETDPARLKRIEVRLSEGKRSLVKFLQAERRSGAAVAPEPVVWLVTPGVLQKRGSVQATITFETANGKRIPWALNGKPTQQDFSYGEVFFTDDDWKPR